MLLALSSKLLFGESIWLWMFVAAVAFTMLSLPDISPHWILRLYQAHPLQPREAPQLTMIIRELAQRAGLENIPRPYWVPSRTTNAFAVGTRNDAAIAVTDGLLQLLSPRELAGVLAHEISHIANNDMRLMGMADLISRMTHLMSAIGILLLLLSLPLMLFGFSPFSIPGILLLVTAPTLSAFLQLGLSRIREYDADLQAADITGDPEGLASALSRIEQRQGYLWRRILFPGYRDPEPSLLRTHPDTADRIQRLLELSRKPAGPFTRIRTEPVRLPPGYRVIRHPRHRTIFRIWH